MPPLAVRSILGGTAAGSQHPSPPRGPTDRNGARAVLRDTPPESLVILRAPRPALGPDTPLQRDLPRPRHGGVDGSTRRRRATRVQNIPRARKSVSDTHLSVQMCSKHSSKRPKVFRGRDVLLYAERATFYNSVNRWHMDTNANPAEPGWRT